ncbi:MAG: phosphoribosylglycinamide synthetase C domain-containing protein, partial [Candidatus Nanopelagicales bacterium]
LLHAAATGTLADVPTLQWSDDAAVCVVVAAQGYPESPVTGGVITGLAEADAVDGVDVLHAGTRADGDQVVSSGGRVLSVVGRGPSIEAARERAYAGVALIDLPESHHRTDIAEADPAF